MPSRVTLKVIKGKLDSPTLEFTERTTVIVGRSAESNLVVPEKHTGTSRMHCLLDINPPAIQVRDTGSRNGTFLNDELIGKREPGETPEEGQLRAYSAFPLKQGDRLKLCRDEVEFEVEIVAAIICHDCGVELTQAEQPAALMDGQYVCRDCQRKTRPRPKQGAQDEDVLAMLLQLIQQAQQDEPDLTALRQYEIQEELGRGGLGIVFKARHRTNGKTVAIKVMRPKVAAKKAGRALFDRERANLQALDHPNIVRFYETGSFGGDYYLAMEYCEYGTVTKLMRNEGRVLELNEALYLTLQMLDGLAYSHEANIPNVLCEDGDYRNGKGLVHRDLKPDNLFLSGPANKPVLKIADFGLAKAFDLAGMSGMTATGQMAGTPHFMPRQQVLNFRYAKPQVDVWAAVASLYFMLTGTPPKKIKAGDDPWVAAADRNAVPIRTHRPDLSPKLADVIDKALKDNPNLHFQSALDFKKALEKVR